MELPTNAQHYLYFPFCNLISFKSSGFYISAIIIRGNRELYFPASGMEKRPIMLFSVGVMIIVVLSKIW